MTTTLGTHGTIDSGLVELAGLSARLCHGHSGPEIALEPREARIQAEHYANAAAAPESLWRPSYDALTTAVVDQWNLLIAQGFSINPWHAAGEPYASSAAMRADLRVKWLWYLPTAQAGDLPDVAPGVGHPMRELVLVDADTWGTQQVLLLNDVFRAVHDAFGHGGGAGFGPVGERRAWAAHRSVLPESARLALWNETTGQNLWTNYGPHMWTGPYAGNEYLGAEIPLRDRPFAPQRIVDVPAEWL